jgi:hypothetical protein
VSLGTLAPVNRTVLPALALFLTLALGSFGCRPLTVVDRAQSDYEGGDYEDAVDRLNDAETLYTNGELPPDYELRYLAYRGLAYYKLAKETNNKGFRRKGRPFVRRALERWKSSEQARTEGWLDPAIVAELEEATKAEPAGAADDGPDEGKP